MTSERRYSETEVAEILERATSHRPGLPPGDSREDGLTLSELQAIGTEVGISPEAMVKAAHSLDRAGGVRRRLGLPLSVFHTVPLPRDLTDQEWERLVADLRETFRARGRVRRHGGLREWYNGNLHALVEPTGDGWRLRMGTTKGSAQQLLGMGSVMFVVLGILTVLSVLGIGPELSRLGTLVGIFGGMGAAGLGLAAVQLPPWARKRRQQMEEIAARVEATVEALPPGGEEGGSAAKP